jgi:metal-dependent hydrolase (beta-lactamase superfamily II)
MFLIFQGICFLMALPAIIISINHYAHNGKLQIIFQKGENKFEVINVSHSLSFNKKDVGTIVEIDSNSSRAPWNLYSYSILKFKDGSEIWLSSILISSANLNKQFYYGKKEYKSQWIPLLKKTMALNK